MKARNSKLSKILLGIVIAIALGFMIWWLVGINQTPSTTIDLGDVTIKDEKITLRADV